MPTEIRCIACETTIRAHTGTGRPVVILGECAPCRESLIEQLDRLRELARDLLVVPAATPSR